MLESKLKKVEVTIFDQGMIAGTKSQHYENKFKAMTQEHEVALEKATHEAQTLLDAAQAQHEQDMATFREGLKSSIALGFECPFWNVDAWETKLRSLGGNPVDHPINPAVGGSSKAVEKLIGAGGATEKDVQANPKADADEDMMNEEVVAP
ncbi:hypothetical protein Hanom_Chr02g00111681 [Helianthus anomalus]